MRRLYRQVYMAIIASLVLVVLFGGIMWRFAPKPAPADEAFEIGRRDGGDAAAARQ